MEPPTIVLSRANPLHENELYRVRYAGHTDLDVLVTSNPRFLASWLLEVIDDQTMTLQNGNLDIAKELVLNRVMNEGMFFIEDNADKTLVLGLDVFTVPAPAPNPNHHSMAISLSWNYWSCLFIFNDMMQLPQYLHWLFDHPQVQLVCWDIMNKLNVLQTHARNPIDVGNLFLQVHGHLIDDEDNFTLWEIINHVLGIEYEMPMDVFHANNMGHWLTEDQMKYAALNSYFSREIKSFLDGLDGGN